MVPDVVDAGHAGMIEPGGDPSLPHEAFDRVLPLAVTTASLRQGRALHPDGAWETRRFRPNIVVDVDDEFSGTVIDKMAMRKAEMTDMRPSGGGKPRVTF